MNLAQPRSKNDIHLFFLAAAIYKKPRTTSHKPRTETNILEYKELTATSHKNGECIYREKDGTGLKRISGIFKT